jgi:hypothetical protein
MVIPSFRIQLWLLAASLVLHEAEEWNIYGWYERNFVAMPANRTKTTIRFFLVFLSVVGFLWVAIAQSFGDSSIASWVVMPLVCLILQNVLQHVYWQIRFTQYAPGLCTAVLLLAPLSLGIIITSTVEHLIPSWYMIALGVAIVPGLVDTVRSGNKLTRALLLIHGFSCLCVELLGLSRVNRSSSKEAA